MRVGSPIPDCRFPDAVVDVAGVAQGKPSPVPCLLAAARLGPQPENCLVIEAASSGVQAGLRAGMTLWGVNTAHAVNGVHRHFTNLREAADDIAAFVQVQRSYARTHDDERSATKRERERRQRP